MSAANCGCLAVALLAVACVWPLFANLAAPRAGLNAAHFSRACLGLDLHRRNVALWWSSPAQFGNARSWGLYRPVPLAVTHFGCTRNPYLADPLPQSGFWVARLP